MELNQHILGLLPPNSSSIAHSAADAFSSLLLLGTYAVRTIFGLPDKTTSSRINHALRRPVDSFILSEAPIALRNLLCNIGADGCYAAGAAPGVVIASPQKTNPDCKRPVRL